MVEHSAVRAPRPRSVFERRVSSFEESEPVLHAVLMEAVSSPNASNGLHRSSARRHLQKTMAQRCSSGIEIGTKIKKGNVDAYTYHGEVSGMIYNSQMVDPGNR